MTKTPLLGSVASVVVSLLLLLAPTAAEARVDGARALQNVKAHKAQKRRLGPLRLLMPASGRITSGFGAWRGYHHKGIDIGVLRSLRVRSAAPGRVVAAGYANGYSGYGKVVVVRYGGRYSLLYAHLSRVGVRPGQLVKRGQRLGLAGCTGHCYGTHLHFEVRNRHGVVNPLRFMRSLR
jgi:murein DD-endopeptidase MepM/ murein hydrolase activator NlpD